VLCAWGLGWGIAGGLDLCLLVICVELSEFVALEVVDMLTGSRPSKTLCSSRKRSGMDRCFTGAFFVLIIACILSATVALAQEPVTGTGTMARHQNAASVQTMGRHQNATFVHAMVRHVAQAHHIRADRLKVGHETSTALPLTGRTLYLAKILDTTTGRTYSVAADETGTLVDAGSLRDAERRAYAARYGKLSPRLFERMGQAESDATISVLVWLDDGGEVPTAPRAALASGQVVGHPPQVQAVRDRHRERMAQMMERRQSPVIADVAARGGRLVFASRLAPMISAELTPAAIRALEKRPDVQALDLDVPIRPLIEEGTQAIRAYEVWSDGLEGDTGTTVAVVESGTVYPSSAYLTVDAYYDTSPCSYAECASQHDHATGVAAVIAKSDVSGAWQGVAPGVRLINGNAGKNATVNDIMDATDWAVSTQGANVINMSWGAADPAPPYEVCLIDAYYDYLVRHNRVTVVAAAGNAGDDPGCDNSRDGQIYSPARGFNVISVGGFYDKETAGWNDDEMYACSSFLDPVSTHGDREEPDVVAPGHSIHTLAWSDADQIPNGTSFAAPFVSGQVALLMQRDDALKLFPETVRSIVMASAINNVEGESRLSERDGAGGIDLHVADEVLENNWHTSLYLTPTSFDANDNYDLTMPVQAGERVRAVIAWNSNPAADYSTDPLDADLDLYILDPDGALLLGDGEYSESFDNSFEIVAFDAAKTGNYTLRINKHRFDGTTEDVGVAWVRIAAVSVSSLDVTSDVPAYFHNPGLSASGGTVYFNSTGGMGAGQTLTVSAAWSSGMAPQQRFEGGAAFGDPAPADLGAPWELAYSVEAGEVSQNIIPFTLADDMGRSKVAYVTFRADNVTGIPPLSSPTHPDENEWYANDDVTFHWSGMSDVSGIAGYSYVLDQTPGTVPNTTIDTANTSRSYPDFAGGTWCFHVRAVDNVGNWGATAHHCAHVDTESPGTPSVSSGTHPDEDVWYDAGDVTLNWTEPSDTGSGVDGYSYTLDHSATTTPDATLDTYYNSRAYDDLADGEWYFHVQAVDSAGNPGSADHYRVRIDTASPPAPSISSATHPVEGTCYPSDDPTFTWGTPNDVSGIVGYSYDFDTSPSTAPDAEVDTSDDNASYTGVADGDWYFHVRAKDGSGKWSATAHYHVCIDTPLVGPVVQHSLTIDDDTAGESDGDADGVVECGEAIELYVGLLNQGTDPAQGVQAALAESDPYVSLTYNTSSTYPDIPGGGWRSNANDFDFTVAPGTPHGHTILFDLDVTASNGGPWADSFAVVVSCERPDLAVPDILVPADPIAGQPVDFTVSVENQGDSATAAWGSFTVACYMDGGGTPFDTDTISGLDAGASTSAHCGWTATEGSHTVRAVVDTAGAIPELDEDNNERSETFAVGGACNDPHESNGSPANATAISYGTTLTEPDVCPPGDSDFYAFTGSTGDAIVTQVEAQALGSSLDSYLVLYDTDGTSIIAQNDNYAGTDSRITHVLPRDGTFYLKVVDANHPNEGGSNYFYHLSLALDQDDAGPIVYAGHTVDDDATGQSSGDGNGVANCGETIELYVDLLNQGTDAAQDVYAALAESDPYVSFVYNTSSSYLDIPGGGSRSNANDFDFTVAPGTPHGHIIHFDLDITTSNCGPWSDGFEVAVSCGNNPPNEPLSPSPAGSSTVPDLDVTLNWTGGDPDGDGVTYDVYLEAWDATPDELICDDVATTACEVGTLGWDARYNWYVVATDVHGESTRGPPTGSWEFFTPSPPVGPLTYVSHRILDDNWWGPGDNDGVLECGEATKLPITLRNEGGYTATTVVGNVAAPADPYVTMIDIGSQAYPDMPGGAVVENETWDTVAFAVAEDTPDGHIIHFDLETEAAFHGPWDDTFDVQVFCPRPDLVVTDIVFDPAEPVHGEYLIVRVDVENRGEVAISNAFEVGCYLDGSGTPYETETVSEVLDPGESHTVACSWTSAVEGSHAIRAVVDDGNATAESDEDNNERTESILVGETCGDVYEPNEGWWNAKQIYSGIYGQPLYAVVCPAGDVDVYVLNILGGTVVQADVDAEPLGSNLDSDLYFYDMDMVNELAHNDNYDGTDSFVTYTVPSDGLYYLKVQEANHPNEGDAGYFYNVTVDVSQQLAYMHKAIDDDSDGASVGNDDGSVDCGETIELYVDIRNEEDRDATGVSGTISESDAYVEVLEATRGYPDMSVFDDAYNTKPFVFSVSPDAPDGHSIHFDMQTSAANRLPLYTGFDVSVTCTNNPPNTPSAPSPADGAADQAKDVDLSWTGGDPDPGDNVTYDVYLGDSSPPPLVVSNHGGPSYDPGTLEGGTTYYWKTVARDNHGATAEGPEWDFTTASAPCIARLDGTDYGTIQAAIDAASTGDVIRVTGTCYEHDVTVDKSITLQGGWNERFTEHDPRLHPTTIDANRQGRVMVIDSSVSIAPTVEYFVLTGGSQGGVYIVTEVDATLRRNIIEDNERLTFTGDGGGVNVHYYGSATLIGNVIRDNRVGRHGGGLTASRNVTLISNVIAANTCALIDANGQGAGMWLGRGELHNNTFANNSGGDGSGIRVGIDVTLNNTIFYGNAVGVNAHTGSVVNMDGTLWYANRQNTTGDGTINLDSVNIYEDPLFVDAGGGDFHLSAGSPAIDAGVAAYAAREDADGNARPDCIAWDLGAYEAQTGATFCFRSFLPAVLREFRP